MEKAIKDVLSEGKNGVKLHSAVQKSFGKYFVEVAPIEDMADLPQDVGEWTLTGTEAWKNHPGGEIPAAFKARLVKWSGGTDEEAGLPSRASLSGKTRLARPSPRRCSAPPAEPLAARRPGAVRV